MDVERRIAHAGLAAQIGNGNPGLLLFDHPDNLRFISGPFGWARVYLKLD